MAQQSKEKTHQSPKRNHPPGDSGPILLPWWRKLKWISVIVLILIISFVALLPWLVTRSGYLKTYLNNNLGLNATLDLSDATLSWFSPTELRGVSLNDREGREVFSCESLQVSYNFYQILTIGLSGSVVDVINPSIHVAVDGQDLNLSNLILDDDSDEPLDHQTVNLRNGVVHFVRDGEKVAQLNGLFSEIAIASLVDGQQLINVSINAEKHLQSQIETSLFSGELAEIQIKTQLDRFNLTLLDTFSAWTGLGETTAALDGSLEANYSWSKNTGSIALSNVACISLADDQIQMIDDLAIFPMKLNGTIGIESEKVSMDQVSIDSKYGRLTASGDWDVQTKGVVESMMENPFRLEGDFDLAIYAKDFPELIPTPDNLELDQAGINVVAFSRKEGDSNRLLVDLRVTDFVGKLDAKPSVTWREPFTVSAVLKRSTGGQNRANSSPVEIELLNCKSDFLQVSGSGDLQNGEGTISFNAEKLKSRLDQFFDLPKFDLSGSGSGKFRIANSTEDQEAIDVRTQLSATKFLFRMPDTEVEFFSDRLGGEIQALFGGDAVRVLGNDIRFENVAANFGGTQLNEPLIGVGADLMIPLSGKTATLESLSLGLIGLTIVARDYQPAGKVDEPISVTLTVTGDLKDAGRWLPLQESDLSGPFRLQGNLKWLAPTSLLSWDATGSVEDFRYSTRPTINGESLSPTRSASPANEFRESLVKIGTIGAVSFSKKGLDRVDWKSFTVEVSGAKIGSVGSVTYEDSGLVLRSDLSGQVSEKRLTPELQKLLGAENRVDGPTAVAGKLEVTWPAQVDTDSGNLQANRKLRTNGRLDLTWNGGELFALPVAKGTIKGRFNENAVTIDSNNLSISGGRLRSVATRFQFNNQTFVRVLPYTDGVVLDRVNIEADVFRSWLRYVAPLLADATEAEGKFSLKMDPRGVDLLLDNLATTNTTIQLDVDTINVKPGPLGQSLLQTAKQTMGILGKGQKIASLVDRKWFEIPNQVVSVTIQNGRVYHDRLQLNLGKLAMYTTGSVGFDNEIDMKVVIPIPEEWVADQPLLKSLVKGGLEIPLRGKLAAPELNLAFMSGLSKRIGAETIGNLLDKGTGGVLDGSLLKKQLLDPDNKGDGILEGESGDLIKKGILKGIQIFRDRK